jgi:NAD+ synthase
MSILYYHAEALHYAAIGTPNKHEVQQGFFVKNGDGGADVMPIAHLYKTQVYQLARALNIPDEIISRTPTSDTYTAEQTQEEFFFQMPFDTLDLYWYAFENNFDPYKVGQVMGCTADDVERIFRGFDRKIKTTEYLRLEPIKY